MVRRRDDMIFAGRPPGTGVWGLDILIHKIISCQSVIHKKQVQKRMSGNVEALRFHILSQNGKLAEAVATSNPH